MLNKFAALFALATMVTMGLQATDVRTEEKPVVVEQKKVTTTTEEKTAVEVKKEECKKTPTLASGCGDKCPKTTVDGEDEVVEETV